MEYLRRLHDWLWVRKTERASLPSPTKEVPSTDETEIWRFDIAEVFGYRGVSNKPGDAVYGPRLIVVATSAPNSGFQLEVTLWSTHTQFFQVQVQALQQGKLLQYKQDGSFLLRTNKNGGWIEFVTAQESIRLSVDGTVKITKMDISRN